MIMEVDMKNFKKWTAIGLTALMAVGMMAGCAKKQAAAETQPAVEKATEAATQAPEEAPVQAAAEAPAQAAAEAAPQAAQENKELTYESKDGWKIKYNPDLFIMSEGDKGEVSFSYQGESAGSNVITISYHKGKMPTEVLYEKTANVDDSKISRSEGWFGGTYPNWSYTRDIAPDKEGSGLGEIYTGIEHNGGTLLVDVLYHRDLDEERNMDTSDQISGVLGTLEFTSHKPQEEMAYKVGTYVREYEEEMEGQEQTVTDTITLNEDHTGMMSFQDDIEIIWSSFELIEKYGDNRYEYDVEGDNLLVNMNDGGDWWSFERKK